jgi:uncharacterized protein YhdP
VDLVQWLREQLDEDERIARAVRVPHDWHQGPGDDPEWTDAELVCMWPPEFHTPYERDKHWRGLTVEGAELAEHIAAHDPARVLREIEAKRRVLRQHEDVRAQVRNPVSAENRRAARVEQGALEDVMRLLALPYADRPGYRQEWAP